MASFKRRQSSDYNQSVPETQSIPEQHAYQEKHFQPVLNQPVSEVHAETEYGSTVTPDTIESRADKTPHSTYTEQSDQPGEDDLANMQVRQNLQNNSDPGTQYSTPDVSSGVSSGPGGFAATGTSATAAATTTASATTVVASSAATTLTTVATATAGVAIITVAFILPLIVGVPSAIIFDEISATDTTVYYSIYFEDYEEDMELTVSLHNNFTNRTHTVDSHSISVLEENLKPGMNYKLTVYGSMGVVLDERSITTKKTSYEPTLIVNTAEFNMSDGLIHLSATLDDPKDSCSDFSLVFYDVKDNARTEVKRVPVTDFSNEITMSPGLATDTSVDGILAVECTSNGEKKVLYEKDLTAYGNPYIGFRNTPRIIDGQFNVECDIVDPASLRYDYHVMVYIVNAEDSSDYFTTDGPLEGGIFTASGVPNYQFHSGFVKVTWEGESNEPLIYEYNTLTLGVATMKNENTEYNSTTYEVKFEVEMILNDDFNYLTDSSGNWRTDKYPEFTSNITQSTLPNTFYEVRKTGDNTYVAVFLAESWNEAATYRLDNTLSIGGFETIVPTFTCYNQAISIHRETNGDATVTLTYTGPSRVSISTASLVGSDGNKIACIVNSSSGQSSTDSYYFTTDFRNLNPNDTYSIYFYNSSGYAMFRDDGLRFESLPVTTSATYGSGGMTATVVFNYSGTSVYMSGIPSATINATGVTLTLTFDTDSNVLTGQEYFNFTSSGTVTYDYYWKAEFEELI